jgi:hypothetical protein
MADKSRIPIKNADFDQYIRNTTIYLQADTTLLPGSFVPALWPPAAPAAAIAVLKNWQRLWLLLAELNQWKGFSDQWSIVYPKYTNPDTRTRVITKQKDDVMEQFTVFAEPLLNRIASGPYIMADDYALFKIKKRDDNSMRHRTAPDIAVEFSVEMQGGGKARFHCRGASDTKRASIPAPYNQVEVQYTISVQPVTALDLLTAHTASTKAIFDAEMGAQNIGKYLSASCRFAKTSDKNLNGPYSAVQNVLIS